MKFFYSTATCSTATHIVLEEAGFAFTPVEVSWKRNVNVEELNKVSAVGAVPTIEISPGKVLTQSSAIMEYIADSKPEKKLLPPAGSFARLETMSWVAFAGADLQKFFMPMLAAPRMTTNTAAQAELRAFALPKIESALAHVDKNLDGKNFIMGQDFTVADAYLFTVIGWCKWAEIKTSSYRNINTYMKRIFDRPAVQKVLKSEELMDYLPN